MNADEFSRIRDEYTDGWVEFHEGTKTCGPIKQLRLEGERVTVEAEWLATLQPGYWKEIKSRTLDFPLVDLYRIRKNRLRADVEGAGNFVLFPKTETHRVDAADVRPLRQNPNKYS